MNKDANDRISSIYSFSFFSRHRALELMSDSLDAVLTMCRTQRIRGIRRIMRGIRILMIMRRILTIRTVLTGTSRKNLFFTGRILGFQVMLTLTLMSLVLCGTLLLLLLLTFQCKREREEG